ncbi:MAG: zf-TFIIB domain-containing protein [Candidatus Bipolaricaulota bacterium]|nr:zf-TFIIB domain-containing protein [Candidatus Bipolaricaulota bacterium]
MYRWVLGLGILVVVGLLAALLVLTWGIATRGVRVEVVEPLRIQGPLAVGGTIGVEGPVEVGMGAVELRVGAPLRVEAPPGPFEVRASLGGAPCPRCGGTLLPVRWNLLTGEITWRCPSCGGP